jgi:hypothetical protein
MTRYALIFCLAAQRPSSRLNDPKSISGLIVPFFRPNLAPNVSTSNDIEALPPFRAVHRELGSPGDHENPSINRLFSR